ncbi:PGF-pre-PGF domain-containing protein [Methanococcoides orientis]|uniref:S-layer protein domain-containing protein n=1 Tax=Methanococcoides orientis TaxID=2822137 RepID=UPI001E5326D9|nr:S-layer protein domain-containing protein [Methanococcoides orientis]UGV40486.1 PGF-pre-PGF domain-containing protein [Methanococcoides orientis]
MILSTNAIADENNNSEFDTLQQYHYDTDGDKLYTSQDEVVTNYLINDQSTSSKEELFNAKYGENWLVSTDKDSNLPNRMIGGSIELLPSDQENDQFSPTSFIQTEQITESLVRNFIVENEQIFGLASSEIELVKEDHDTSLYERKNGISNIVYQQSYEGIPVYSSRVGITVNDGKVVAVDSNNFQDITAPTKPTITEAEALSIISDDLGIEVTGPSIPLSSTSLSEMSGKSTPQTKTIKTKDISLVIYPVEIEDANKYHLVYMVDLSTIKEPLRSWTYFVDATTGNVLHKYDKIFSYSIEGNVTGRIYQEYPSQDPVDVPFWNQTISLIIGDPKRVLYSGRGDYLENSAITIEPIDLTGAVNSKLNFSTKYEIEYNYDYAYVIISEDGNNFTNLANYTGYQTSWTDKSIDISDWDGKQAWIGFLYDTDLGVSKNGFYADNITVTSDSGMVFSDDLEDLNGNWNLSGFSVQAETLSSPLTTTDKNGYYNITDLSENATIYSELSGPYVKVVNEDQEDASIEFDLTAPIYDWNWADMDTSDKREESNVFYHVNVIHDYFTKGSPFDINSMDYQTIATVEYGSSSGNAMSDGTDIYFYGGNEYYESFAILSDVIYHEYTHCVVDHIYTTYLPYRDESGALNEGWADYFGSTINNDPINSEEFCVGDTEGITNLNNNNKYPSDIMGEVHYDGLIVSGAMWDMRVALGAELADELIIRAMKLEPQNFQEFLEAILIVDDDNGDLSDGTPHINEIIQAFYVNHGIYTPVFFDALSEHLISNGQIVEEMHELRSPVFSGTDLDDIIGQQDTDFLELSAVDFPGFYYDIDDNISTETLRIYGGSFVSDRTIGQGGLVYTTTIQEVEFMGYSSEYPLLILFGEEYVPLNNTPDKLTKLLADNDDAHTLRTGQLLELQEGYAITPRQIDVDGEKVWLELTKNGTFVDDTIINASFSQPTSDRTWYCMQDMSGEEDVVTLMIHVSTVYGQDDPCVILDDIWQISDQVTEINADDKYGQMVVSSVNDTALTMELDEDIVLDAGSTNNLMDNFELQVADDPSLRFYLKKKQTESGIYEVRGTVIDSPSSDKTYTWNANSFAGFWYDLDNNATSEVLTVHGVDNMDRMLDADIGELIYNTTIVPGIQPQFDFRMESDPLMDFTYEKIGFLGEEYVPITNASILTKLIIDDNSINIIGIGDSLNLGEGYVVTPKEIDVNGENVWLELTRNGTFVDDTIINANTSDKTWYYEQDMLNESDILTLMLHVDEVNQSGNFIIIDGVWQLSEEVIEINVDDRFGRLAVSSVDDQTITMELSGYLYLSSGKSLYLTENIALRIADNSSNLRFYPFTESTYVKPNVAPIATIGSIAMGGSPEGVTVIFNGSGTDSDGTIVAYNWTSSLDGQLNTSANFSTSSLSVGTHTIYFSVQDNDGAWSEEVSTALKITDIDENKSPGSKSTSSGGGGGATGEAFENILVKDAAASNVVAGKLSRYEFNEEKCHIGYVQFKGVDNAGQISTLIEVLKDTSKLVDSQAPGIVYQNMNIWVGNAAFGDDKIEDAVIGFRVSKQWLSENSIDVSGISLYHYSEEEWNQLSTTKVDEDGAYIYFEAKTPGFSPFAIAADMHSEALTGNTTSAEEQLSTVNSTEPSGEELPASESKGIPGFTMLASVFILEFVCLFRKRKN